MHIHRTEHVRNFTVLPNSVLQYRQLSYTARGLLVDLLSRPYGWREDARQMADTSPQGRGTLRKALKELAAAGFYRAVVVRLPDGTLRTEIHVYDTPQPVLPDVTRPAAGRPICGGTDALSKNREKEPSLPALRTGDPVPADRPTAKPEGRAAKPEGRAAKPEGTAPKPEGTAAGAEAAASGGRTDRQPVPVPDEQLRTAVATLFRVIRPEPRLRLGEAEAHVLAPLVARWLERGSTPADLAQALLPGLPAQLHSAVAVLRSRLERKMPPVQAEERRPTARYAECARCHDPVPRPGICGPCAGLGTRTTAVGGGSAATRTGAARARDAMRGARAALRLPPAALAGGSSPGG